MVWLSNCLFKAQPASTAGNDKTGFRNFNYATQSKRSPGSTIKPLVVYTPAVEAGWALNKQLV